MKMISRHSLLRRFFGAAALLFMISVLPVKAEPKAFDYILPDSDTHVYTAAEVGVLPLQAACYARNEIYARHGRKFTSAELSGYFNEQVWYNGTIEAADFSDSLLSETEQANVAVLAEREKLLSPEGYALDQPGFSYQPIYDYLYGDRFNLLENLEIYGTEGTSVMETSCFSLLLPPDLPWSYRQLDGSAFAIYCSPGAPSIYDGWVVTIRAYDWDADEYVDAPNWTVCGLSSSKKYVAFFPTDVRYDPEDPAFAEAYQAMREWALTLDYEAQGYSDPFSAKD